MQIVSKILPNMQSVKEVCYNMLNYVLQTAKDLAVY